MRTGSPPPLQPLAIVAPVAGTAAEECVVNYARTAATHAVFEDLTRTLGISFVPDLFVGMSSRPAYLEAAWELFKEDLGLDRMDRRTRHMVALAITTDETGTYCIAAYPHAFRVNALDEATCDKVLFTIRLFNAFERFLSGVSPAYAPQAVRFVRAHWREEYMSDGATMATRPPLQIRDAQPEPSWLEKTLVAILIVVIVAIGAYLVLL